MKSLLILLVLSAFYACSDAKPHLGSVKTKVVCGDSVDQEMFDEYGNSYQVRVPGKCDTITINED